MEVVIAAPEELTGLAADTIDETMARLIQSKRAHVSAVTDGRTLGGDGLLDAVVRELRGGEPVRHLRIVGDAATRRAP